VLKIAEFGVWAVTFGVDAFIPITVWFRPGFVWNESGYRVFSWGLVKMPVNANRSLKTWHTPSDSVKRFPPRTNYNLEAVEEV
jgi:hypothetical protein